MTKKYRRNHNLKHISKNRSYTVKEVAEKIGVQKKTVYAWIKRGLPKIEGSSPERLHGSDIKQFHKRRRKSQEKPCKDNEMLCCSCQKPQKVCNNEIQIEYKTEKRINFKGKCNVCGCNMNRTISPKKIEYFKQAFCSPAGQQLTLEGF